MRHMGDAQADSAFDSSRQWTGSHRGGQQKEAITSDSSAFVFVTCDPNRRDANASAVLRSLASTAALARRSS